MSDSEGYEAVTVSDQGVTVTKRFEADEFPVPAIAFEFVSDRDEPVRLTLTDPVPEGVEVDDLGFHPEYGSEYWTIDEEEVTFERELAANTEYTTVYGIRATGTDDVARFLQAPSISTVDPPRSGAQDPEDALEDDQDVVRDVISGASEAPPGLETENGSDDEDVEPLELNDPDGEGAGAAVPTESEESSREAAPVTTDERSLVSALASELRNGEVSEEDVKLLREALEIAGERGGTVTARVDRIQADVANLRAYTDALEEFLDENGTAEQVVEDFREDVDRLTDSVAALESTVDMHDDSLESVDGDVSELRAGVEDLESSIASLESDVDQIQADLPDEGVTNRVEELEDDLEDIRSWQEQIKQTFGGE